MDQVVWKVYLPHELFVQSMSSLFGHVNSQNQSVYVTAASCDVPLTSQLPEGIRRLGTWTKSAPQAKDAVSKHQVWIDVSLDNTGDVCCNVIEGGRTVPCACIIYNPAEILHSFVLVQRSEGIQDSSNNILSLVNTLKTSETLFRGYRTRSGNVTFSKPDLRSATSDILLNIVLLIMYCLHLPFKNLGIVNESSKSWIFGTGSIFGLPSCFTQLGNRSRKLRDARVSRSQPYHELRRVNVCMTQLLDTVLGLILMYFLMHNNKAQYLANICLAYGDKVADEMKVLLDWLMGAPAGLKLNSQLTHFLGKFFQYHIFLWTGYLAVIRPVLGELIYYSSVAGVLGLTVQLALFQDIFSTMTIHIYCFYVYAARLYKLEMYALGSLWRLFRGKKWNVLRQRVDSAVYDADQLFVGTLLFTVLLFLLPTIGLYYVVFTLFYENLPVKSTKQYSCVLQPPWSAQSVMQAIMGSNLGSGIFLLRILVLAIQGFVFRMRNFINTTPWWSILKWATGSPSLIDGVVFSIISSRSGCLVLSMQGTKASLGTVRTLTTSSMVGQKPYSWGTILRNLVSGELIYPWIERKAS